MQMRNVYLAGTCCTACLCGRFLLCQCLDYRLVPCPRGLAETTSSSCVVTCLPLHFGDFTDTGLCQSTSDLPTQLIRWCLPLPEISLDPLHGHRRRRRLSFHAGL